MSRNIRYFFSFILVISILLGSFNYIQQPVYASQALDNAQADKALAEAKLNEELAQLDVLTKALKNELVGVQGKSASLSRDISILTNKIKQSKLDIQSKNLTITKLGGEITQKSKTILSLNIKIETEKDSLAQLIRKEREIDDKSILALILSQDSISDAYGDIDTFASIKRDIKKSVDEILGVKTETESEKKTLEIKKNQETDTKVKLEEAKRKVELNQAEQNKLLSINKNNEKEYQKVLADKAKRRAEILAMLFNLRDTSAIPFPKALEFANFASKQTGVRPAFILAILKQESAWGSDIGSCYVTNTNNGDGKGVNTGTLKIRTMNPTRDIPIFINITNSVGRDYNSTRVSCWQPAYNTKGEPSGWGGAMGPAQFIPSTWIGLKNSIAKALGVITPDPWNPKDAFMASSIFLRDLGASAGGYTAERNAACKYYSGSKCPSGKKTYTNFEKTIIAYGNGVTSKAKDIQETMIDPLQN